MSDRSVLVWYVRIASEGQRSRSPVLEPVLCEATTSWQDRTFSYIVGRMGLANQRGYLERMICFVGRWFGAATANDNPVETYAAGHFPEGNWWYRFFFAKRTPAMRVDTQNFAAIKEKAASGSVIYYTVALGQIEFGICNDICNRFGLPPIQWNNQLNHLRWRRWKDLKRLCAQRKKFAADSAVLPHPLSTGLVTKLIQNRESILFSLEPHHGDLLTGFNGELVRTITTAQQNSPHPIWLVPFQLVWDKRPQREHPSFWDILFGVTENPGKFRKLVLYFRYYQHRAVVRFGEPIAVTNEWTPEVLHKNMLSSLVLEKRSLTGPPLRPRSWFLERVLGDDPLTSLIYSIAKEKNKPVANVQRLALRYAKEILPDIRYSYLSFGLRCLNWFFRNFYGEIHVDEAGIQRLKKLLAKGPVILAPNHRSHVDYLLVAHLCDQNDLVIPQVASGNNLNFWPVGPYFRRCGAFFMRRTFAGNQLYKEVFQTYLKILIQEGYLQEFFIEGGRSRTGKLRSPKMGILSMISETMLKGAVPDVTILPICITYEKILEQKAYLKELEGETKAAERTWDLWQLRRYLRRRRGHGQIYVNFDTPISWKEAAQETPGNKPVIVRKLADRITHAINRQVVVTPMAVVSSAILAWSQNGLTEERIKTDFKTLHDYLLWKGVSRSAPLKQDEAYAFAEALATLRNNRLILFHEGLQNRFYEIPVATRKNLDLYKNTIIHYFISLSFWCNLLLSKRNGGMALEELRTTFEFLQQLFYFEFRFSTRMAVEEHLEKLSSYLQQKGFLENRSVLHFFAAQIENFIESYQIALDVCRIHLIHTTPLKKLTQEMHIHGHHLLLLNKIQHPEAISQSNFENAVQAFQELDLAKNGDKIAGCLKLLQLR